MLPIDESGVLVCVPNWLGDSVMALPAVRAFRERHAARRVTILAKPAIVPLWQMSGVADACLSLAPGVSGTLRAARALRRAQVEQAYVLPNSMRSGLIPFLGGVPFRRGTAGHQRCALMTEVVDLPEDVDRGHQWREGMYIMGCTVDGTPRTPLLEPTDDVVATCRDQWARLGLADRPPVGLIPGAMRGAAKRWPAEHFIELGRQLAGEEAIVLFGAPSETDDVARIAKAIGNGAISVAGQTSLETFAGMLALCRTVVTNDSGGMHLAAAVGTSVVAIFGMTDPDKTGPLGPGHIILRASDEGAREIERDAPEAIARLRALSPDRVLTAVRRVLSS